MKLRDCASKYNNVTSEIYYKLNYMLRRLNFKVLEAVQIKRHQWLKL